MADTWCGLAGVVALRWRRGSTDFQSRTTVACFEPMVEQLRLCDLWRSCCLRFPMLSQVEPRGCLRRDRTTDGRIDRLEMGRRALHQLPSRRGLAWRGGLVVGEFVRL